MGGLFYLNAEASPRRTDTHPPHTTVLEYLRGSGLVGTKEGCATGDCGACTAAVVALEGNKLSYRSLNTCIAPLGSLHGRQLITVDGLADEDGGLHPVQKAVAEAHGSQCGFCTPGFVMSLFTHLKNGASARREDVIESIGGNLCRCTGYLPLVRAGRGLARVEAKDRYARSAATIRRRLRALGGKPSASAPTTIAQLGRQLAKKDPPRIVAGATDLGLEITQQLASPALVDVRRVRELRGIKATATRWEIGAATSWEECAQELSPHLPGFGELMRRFGSPQIRAQATVGGNLGTASPIADGPPVFLALGCTLVLQKGARKRRVALEDYYTGYRETVLEKGELIRTIVLDRPPAGARFDVFKVSKRIEDDISTVCAAFLLKLDDEGRVATARIAYGGMAATPLRAHAAEEALVGRRWNQASVAAARCALGSDYEPLDDQRASARYRTQVAANLLERFALKLQGRHVDLAQLRA